MTQEHHIINTVRENLALAKPEAGEDEINAPWTPSTHSSGSRRCPTGSSTSALTGYQVYRPRRNNWRSLGWS